MKKILLLVGVVSLFSCKKYLDVNDNPNTPLSTRADFIFTNALTRTAANQVGGQHITSGSWVGYYGHSTSFTGGGTEKTYSFTNVDFNYWNALYDNLNDYQYVIDNAAKDGYPHLAPRAKVMQVLVWQQLVDLYGDVPYFNALKGIAALTPKYDAAQAVYEDLIKQLDAAIPQIKATPTTTANEDVLYLSAPGAPVAVKGAGTTWVKLANTLKMRILMRQSFIAGRDAYITGEIAKINTEGSGFITENVLIQPGYQNSPGKLNPFYATYGYNEVLAQQQAYAFRKVGSVIINFLKSSADTFRLQRIANPAGSTTPTSNLSAYVGVPLGGAGSAYLEGATSSVGSMQIFKGDATRPSILITAAEKYFLLAEAAQRYGTTFVTETGNAQTLYENGVKWAFRLTTAAWTSTSSATYADADAAATKYLAQAQNLVNWAASTDKVRAILVQKWVSLIHINGLEAWSDYRKSNGTTSVSVPASVKTVASTSKSEPVRLYYPLIETNANSTGLPGYTSNPDYVYNTRIFWDVN